MEEYLEKVLRAAPQNFQIFLEKQAESKDVLKDTLSGDQLTAKAIDMALRAAKMKPGDVENAINASFTALQTVKADFSAHVQKQRTAQIDAPNRKIQATLMEISGREAQVAKLNEEVRRLQASIEPTRQEIAQAENHIKEGEQLFQRSCQGVEKKLAQMKQAILARLGGGSNGK